MLGFSSKAQLLDKVKLPESKMKMVKMGPLLGAEFGKYTNVNFGLERQWQQLKLIKPQTHAAFLLFDYNFRYKVMGAQAGYWFKVGRINLTYGARMGWHTDYDEHRFGIGPNVGYKFLQAHLQLGVNFQTPTDFFKETNMFYASVRWVFINSRDFRKN